MGADEHSHHRDGHAIATSLGPALIEHCNGRLSSIEWFRSTWQHGGAATGLARWTHEDGRVGDVFVKLPIGPVEHRWTSTLASTDEHAPTPRVIATGSSLGGYDLAWVVVERLDGQTLNHGWSRQSLDDLIRAAAHLQARAVEKIPVGAAPPSPDWARLIARAREVARKSDLPEAQHWNDVEKRVQKVLPRLAAKWSARPIDSWCHGDLHPGNAMRRNGSGACVLIDLALVHAGSWVEDAVYLERQFWGRPEGLFDIHPVSLLAKYRRELGLKTEGDYGHLAMIRRVLMAACAPVYLEHEGHPRYLHAALQTIDRYLPQVAH